MCVTVCVCVCVNVLTPSPPPPWTGEALVMFQQFVGGLLPTFCKETELVGGWWLVVKWFKVQSKEIYTSLLTGHQTIL